MRSDSTIALRLVYDLIHCDDRDDYLRSVAVRLRDLFTADLCMWTAIDLIAMESEVVADGIPVAYDFEQALSAYAFEHPAILSYLRDPTDLCPRRVSDVVPDLQWFNSRVYDDLFRPYGATRQLSLVVLLEPPGRGEGWVLTRHGQDFTSQELDLAYAVLPALTATHRLFRRTALPVHVETQLARSASQLTPREADVLRLLSSGLSGVAISRVLGISPRTVHKHLEHAYSKLGEHDRLRAVDAARSLGLVGGTSH